MPFGEGYAVTLHLAKKQRRPRREGPERASLSGVGDRDSMVRAEGSAHGVLFLASRWLWLPMAHAPPFLS